MGPRHVDDRQTAMAESNGSMDPCSAFIGASMPQACGHCLDQAGIDRTTVKSSYPGYSAHSEITIALLHVLHPARCSSPAQTPRLPLGGRNSRKMMGAYLDYLAEKDDPSSRVQPGISKTSMQISDSRRTNSDPMTSIQQNWAGTSATGFSPGRPHGPQRIGLLGAGAQAREVLSYLPSATEVFFAVSREYLNPDDSRQIDIRNPSPVQRSTPVICTVGPPALRRKLVAEWPGENFTNIVAAASYVDSSCEIGPGSIISPGVIITVDTRVGAHSQINIGSTISHDVLLESFVTVGPGVHIAGGVKIGNGAFLGTGANLINGITIASGVVIGAGAVVLEDVSTPNAVVVGAPGRIIRVNNDWLERI